MAFPLTIADFMLDSDCRSGVGIDYIVVQPEIYAYYKKYFARLEKRAHRRRMIRRQGGKH